MGMILRAGGAGRQGKPVGRAGRGFKTAPPPPAAAGCATGAERVLNALAGYRIVAWRVLRLTMLGRATPAVSCEAMRSESKWTAVYTVVMGKRVPKGVPQLGVMVRLIARRGGSLDRTGDPPPGPTAMRIGWQAARTLALAWETFGPGAKTCEE